jgi:hypothetical protein
MIIRNCLASDAEHEARIYNSAASHLPGFVPITVEEVRRSLNGHGVEPAVRIFAEHDGRPVGYCMFEPTGRIHFPWCLSGHEGIGHALFATAARAMAERRVTRAYATCRADWKAQIEFFEDHEFDRVRDMVNFAQSIGDLPTMFQRPGLNVSIVRPADVWEIERLAPNLLRIHGNALAEYFLNNRFLPTDAVYILRRDGVPRGVGLLVDDESFASVESLDPLAPVFRFGAFGTEGLPSKRVNGLFSFLAAPGKDALHIGQDLLWYGTSRMESNTFDMLAAQVPSDAPHLLGFYERYFQRQGSFPIFEREVGTGSRF